MNIFQSVRPRQVTQRKDWAPLIYATTPDEVNIQQNVNDVTILQLTAATRGHPKTFYDERRSIGPAIFAEEKRSIKRATTKAERQTVSQPIKVPNKLLQQDQIADDIPNELDKQAFARNRNISKSVLQQQNELRKTQQNAQAALLATFNKPAQQTLDELTRMFSF